MPRVLSIMPLQGTMMGVTYYRRNGKNLARKKTSLTKKRVKTDPAFENSRKASSIFGQASAIASGVYRSLPPRRRKHGLIGKLTGMATKLLHEGKTQAKVKEALMLKMNLA